jgi:hypothetical protein
MKGDSMAGKIHQYVSEKGIVEFMDACFVLHLMIDQVFENNSIVLLNKDIEIEWEVIKISLENIHKEISSMK